MTKPDNDSATSPYLRQEPRSLEAVLRAQHLDELIGIKAELDNVVGDAEQIVASLCLLERLLKESGPVVDQRQAGETFGLMTYAVEVRLLLPLRQEVERLQAEVEAADRDATRLPRDV